MDLSHFARRLLWGGWEGEEEPTNIEVGGRLEREQVCLTIREEYWRAQTSRNLRPETRPECLRFRRGSTHGDNRLKVAGCGGSYGEG